MLKSHKLYRQEEIERLALNQPLIHNLLHEFAYLGRPRSWAELVADMVIALAAQNKLLLEQITKGFAEQHLCITLSEFTNIGIGNYTTLRDKLRAVACPTCNGEGFEEESNRFDRHVCPCCKGTGFRRIGNET